MTEQDFIQGELYKMIARSDFDSDIKENSNTIII